MQLLRCPSSVPRGRSQLSLWMSNSQEDEQQPSTVYWGLWCYCAEDLDARGENLVIGLNPPYGMNNALAAKFQEQAAKFRPRLIVLIVPPTTPVSPSEWNLRDKIRLHRACRPVSPGVDLTQKPFLLLFGWTAGQRGLSRYCFSQCIILGFFEHSLRKVGTIVSNSHNCISSSILHWR